MSQSIHLRESYHLDILSYDLRDPKDSSNYECYSSSDLGNKIFSHRSPSQLTRINFRVQRLFLSTLPPKKEPPQKSTRGRQGSKIKYLAPPSSSSPLGLRAGESEQSRKNNNDVCQKPSHKHLLNVRSGGGDLNIQVLLYCIGDHYRVKGRGGGVYIPSDVLKNFYCGNVLQNSTQQ